MVKNPLASAGDTGDVGSIPGSERFPWRRNWKPAPVLAWRIPWTEEPGGLQLVGLQRALHDLATEHACTSLLRILSTAPELEDSGVGNSKITWELRGRTGLPFLSPLEAQLVESAQRQGRSQAGSEEGGD